MDLDALDKLDAFRVRFCDLQVVLGNKVFRSLLTLEMEPNGSNLDLLNRIDKRGLLPSFELCKKYEILEIFLFMTIQKPKIFAAKF